MDMEHPVFGSIDYSGDQWEGRVSLPLFAAYHYRPSRFSPPEPGAEFDLVIQDEAGTGPTPAQERAFTHCEENEDRICAAVVAAIFAYYQEQYQDRELLTDGCSPAEIEALFPALESAEGLQELIRFDTLYVLEGLYMGQIGPGDKPETVAKLKDAALLGFAFRCSWDVEHGVGVLIHRDQVVQVGSGDIAWNGTGDF
jgi:hypothetical protein